MELNELDLTPGSDDEIDSKISDDTKQKARKIWINVSFVLTWVSLVLFLWDDVSAFLVYKHWDSTVFHDGLRSCIVAWIVFSSFGVAVTALVTYNTVCHSLKFLCGITKAHPLPHQYTACIGFYVHEIPKSIIYLVLVTRYRILPELRSQYLVSSPSPISFLGHTKYDHLYFKIVPDVLKMLALFLLGFIEFREITKKDKNKVLLVLNSVAMVCHQCFIIASITVKIIVEKGV